MPKQQKQQQYDARKLYRNGTTIEVPGHTALKICDKITGAKNNFCIPKATDLKETFEKKNAKEPVTIKISEARELTFNKINTCTGSNGTNGAYGCTVEDVELWIHDNTRATEFTPIFLAFDQQKENDNSDYNTRPALDKDYGEIGLPQRIVINLQRCQTDWLSMVKRSSEFDGCLPGDKLPKWRRAIPNDLGMTFLGKYPGYVFKEQPKRFFELLPDYHNEPMLSLEQRSLLCHLVELANSHVRTKGKSPSIVAAFKAIAKRAELLLGDARASCVSLYSSTAR